MKPITLESVQKNHIESLQSFAKHQDDFIAFLQREIESLMKENSSYREKEMLNQQKKFKFLAFQTNLTLTRRDHSLKCNMNKNEFCTDGLLN